MRKLTVRFIQQSDETHRKFPYLLKDNWQGKAPNIQGDAFSGFCLKMIELQMTAIAVKAKDVGRGSNVRNGKVAKNKTTQ